LRELRQHTVVSVESPASDGKQRASVFMQAHQDTKDLCVMLHPDARARFSQGFLHFACIAGPKDFPDYRGTQLNLPFGSPFLMTPLPDVENLAIRSGRLSLEDVDIQIVSTWLPGTLWAPVAFTNTSA